MTEKRLRVVIDGSAARSGATQVTRSLDDIRAKARATNKEMRRTGSEIRFVGYEALNLRRLLNFVIAASAISQISQYSDAWVTAESRIRLVTSSTAELTKVQGQLFRVAQDTRNDFSETVNVYARLARATKRLGVEQATVLSVSKSLAQAVTIGGGTKESTAAGLFQLSQGIAAGALRGQELNSVLEQLPRVAQTIADEIANGDVGALRKLAEEGKITSKVIIDAFVKQGAALDAEFKKMGVTFGQALTVMGNAWTKLIGQLGERTGISAAGAGAIRALAENLEEVVSAATDAAVALGTLFIARGLAPAIASAGAFVAAQTQLHTAVLSGNASYINGAKAAAAKAAAEKTAAVATLESASAERARSFAVVASIEAEIVAQNARRASYVGLSSGPAAESLRANLMAREIALSRDLAAAKGVLAAADNSVAVATVRATAATTAHTLAMRASTVAAIAATYAMRALNSVMAFFGGPIGAAIVVTVGALYMLSNASREASRKADELYDSYFEVSSQLSTTTKLSKEQTAQTIRDVQAQQAKIKSNLMEAQSAIALQQALQNDGRLAALPGGENIAKQAGKEISDLQSKIDDLLVAGDQAAIDLKNLMAGVFTGSNTADSGLGEGTEKLAKFVQSLRDELKIMSYATAQREVETAVMKARNLAIEDGTALTKIQEDSIRSLVGQIQAKEAADKAAEKAVEDFNDAQQLVNRYIEDGSSKIDLYKKASIELEIALETLAKGGFKLSADEAERLWAGLEKIKDDGKSGIDELKDAIDGWGKRTSQVFADMLTGGEASFKDLSKAFINETIQMILYANLFATAFNRIKAAAGGGGWIGALGSVFTGGFAKGGAFSGGNEITAFAKGGVVNKPTLFPMAKGAGLMGEAGPEAVMPLARGPNGVLGVRSHGGAGVVQHISFGVEVNVQGGSQGAEQDEAMARRVGAVVESQVRSLIGKELRNAIRPGGLYSRAA
ncbi:MAG: phage tail tape measure protein [Parvibaculum sp.]|nr:phage tail tape measure protein [Parvibaculum sp.]